LYSKKREIFSVLGAAKKENQPKLTYGTYQKEGAQKIDQTFYDEDFS
jgi:hypothetical protein